MDLVTLDLKKEAHSIIKKVNSWFRKPNPEICSKMYQKLYN